MWSALATASSPDAAVASSSSSFLTEQLPRATAPLLSGVIMAPPELTKSGHLVWDPGFGKKFLSGFGVLTALALCAQQSTFVWIRGSALQAHATSWVQGLAHQLEWWSLLGMLSSSCCALQLILNAFSFGCAGFNTVLGPVRPFFLALTAFLQALVWRNALFTGRGPSLISSAIAGTALSACLSFLPEAVALFVERGGGGAAQADVPALTLQVSGMGCTACTLKVQTALEKLDGVSSCSVDLKTGAAKLLLDEAPRGDDDHDATELARRAVEAVEKAGFETQHRPTA